MTKTRQNSYLPLQWIDLSDVDPSVGPDCLRSTYEIDARSLGGVRPRGDVWAISADLRERTPSLDIALAELKTRPRDRMARVFFFARDLEQCLAPTVGALRANAYLVWTVGNRRVGGIQVSLDKILAELIAEHECELVTTVHRRIPSKRMATRNRVAATMRIEQTLVFRKRPACGVAR